MYSNVVVVVVVACARVCVFVFAFALQRNIICAFFTLLTTSENVGSGSGRGRKPEQQLLSLPLCDDTFATPATVCVCVYFSVCV